MCLGLGWNVDSERATSCGAPECAAPPCGAAAGSAASRALGAHIATQAQNHKSAGPSRAAPGRALPVRSRVADAPQFCLPYPYILTVWLRMHARAGSESPRVLPWSEALGSPMRSRHSHDLHVCLSNCKRLVLTHARLLREYKGHSYAVSTSSVRIGLDRDAERVHAVLCFPRLLVVSVQ